MSKEGGSSGNLDQPQGIRDLQAIYNCEWATSPICKKAGIYIRQVNESK